MQELQLSKDYKLSYIYIAAAMLVGKRMPRHPPIFPHNIIEKCPNSFARNSVFIGPNDFKFSTETRCMVLQAISKFGAN